MKVLITLTMILVLNTGFAQEIPFVKQGDKQTHFAVAGTMVAPISYEAALKLTDNKFKAALLSLGFTSAIAGGYELIHDKALGRGHPSWGDFFSGLAAQVVYTAASTIIRPSDKQKANRKQNKINRKQNKANKKANRKANKAERKSK